MLNQANMLSVVYSTIVFLKYSKVASKATINFQQHPIGVREFFKHEFLIKRGSVFINRIHHYYSCTN